MTSLHAVVCAGCGYKNSVSDSYALEQVTDMIVVTINKNDHTQIVNWEDLRASYELTQQGYNNFTFDELKGRIHVEFPVLVADPKKRPVKTVVRLKRAMDETELAPIELDANERIANAISRNRGS